MKQQPHQNARVGDDSPPDEVLITHALSTRPPQEWAFAALWRRHQGYIRAFCTRRLGAIAEAEDVAQNVAMKAYGALGQFERRSRFRTWLTAIAMTQCADYQRREFRQKDIARRLFAVHSGLPEGRIDNEPEDHVLIGRSTRALCSLPARAREVLMMRFYRDLSLEDMGRELNIGPSSTKMRLYRSINRLRSVYFELDALDAQKSTPAAGATSPVARQNTT